ncbi:plasmid mobilization protein [Marinifilum fragile]|uniref:plasmid mobilization protein n=1 Tax=Marinifilum fragile TaxID=570161 RepID=UPI002AAC1D63|nr:plasmid mobilization relaxosome protein MobC [Marinifilum fragile]
MARPRKNRDDLRVHCCNVRLTKSEKQYAEREATKISCSVANWLRKSAFSKEEIQVSTMPREYYKQLIGLSNNINQIAKSVNQKKYTKISADIEEVKELLLKIYNLFQK